jgi:hypothetical protein
MSSRAMTSRAMTSRAMTSRALAVLGLVAAASCSSARTDPGNGFPGFCATTSTHRMARALIGPDVNIGAVCGGITVAPIASVDVEGSDSTMWSVAVEGDDAFSLTQTTFVTCGASSPAVASVTFTPPPTALPGDTFDAVVTVSSNDGSFAPGAVKVHGVVAAPDFTLTPSDLDFGQVAPDQSASRGVTVIDDSVGPATIVPLAIEGGGAAFGFPMVMRRSARRWTAQVRFAANTPGTYSATWTWQAGASAPAGCLTKKTVTLHATVVGAYGGADDGGASDADDASGADDASDADGGV